MTTSMLPLDPSRSRVHTSGGVGTLVGFLSQAVFAATGTINEESERFVTCLSDLHTALRDFDDLKMSVVAQKSSIDMFVPESVSHTQTCILKKAIEDVKNKGRVGKHRSLKAEANGGKRTSVDESPGGCGNTDAPTEKKRKLKEGASSERVKYELPDEETWQREHVHLWEELRQASLPKSLHEKIMGASGSGSAMRLVSQELDTILGMRLLCQSMGCFDKSHTEIKEKKRRRKRKAKASKEEEEDEDEDQVREEEEEPKASDPLSAKAAHAISSVVDAWKAFMEVCAEYDALPSECPEACALRSVLRGDVTFFPSEPSDIKKLDQRSFLGMCFHNVALCREAVNAILRQQLQEWKKGDPYDWVPTKQKHQPGRQGKIERDVPPPVRQCTFTGAAMMEDCSAPPPPTRLGRVPKVTKDEKEEETRGPKELTLSDRLAFAVSAQDGGLGVVSATQRNDHDVGRDARWRVARATTMGDQAIVVAKWPAAEPTPLGIAGLIEAKQGCLLPTDVENSKDNREANKWALLMSDTMTSAQIGTLLEVHRCISAMSSSPRRLFRYEPSLEAPQLRCVEGVTLLNAISQSLLGAPVSPLTPDLPFVPIGLALRSFLAKGKSLEEAIGMIERAIEKQRAVQEQEDESKPEASEICFSLPDPEVLDSDLVAFVLFAAMDPACDKSNLHFPMRNRLRWWERKNKLEGDCCLRRCQEHYTPACKDASYANQCGVVVSFDAAVAVKHEAIREGLAGVTEVPVYGTEGLVLCDLLAVVLLYDRHGKKSYKKCAVLKSSTALSGSVFVGKVHLSNPKKGMAQNWRALQKHAAKQHAGCAEGPPAFALLPCETPVQVRVLHPWIVEEALGVPSEARCLRGKSPLGQLAILDYMLVRSTDGQIHGIQAADVRPRSWI